MLVPLQTAVCVGASFSGGQSAMLRNQIINNFRTLKQKITKHLKLSEGRKSNLQPMNHVFIHVALSSFGALAIPCVLHVSTRPWTFRHIT